MRPPEIIDTPRLRLRPPVMEDALSIFEDYAQDAQVTRYLLWRPHKGIKETHDFLERSIAAWETGCEYSWVLTQRGDDRLVGMVGIRIDGSKVELGYVLARPHWGRVYMPEAVRAVIEWALEQEGIYRVWAVCDVENSASVRVLEKVGMQREGVLRRWNIHPNPSDEPRDCFRYSIAK